ncbi:MAG: FMN-binding protein [Clostridiales bacterium]|nr:FMN-binding protein [Clostridiales bacterium]
MNIRWGLQLLILLVIFSIVTGAVYKTLEDRILANSMDFDDIDIPNLLPGASSISPTEDIELIEDEPVETIYEAYDEDIFKGYIIKVESQGYSSIITTVVAIDNEGGISGIDVLDQNETEGLGDKIANDEYTDRFRGKTAASPLNLVEDETIADDEIQNITGATKSAQGVITGVNYAIEFYNSQLKGRK